MGAGRGKEEGEGGAGAGKANRGWGGSTFVLPPSCDIVPDASEAVCIPHAASFDVLDACETVCIPHTASFVLPGPNERCVSHTPLRSSLFYSPVVLRGILSVRGRVNPTRCPRFFFVSNGGGDSRRPPFFPFDSGAA